MYTIPGWLGVLAGIVSFILFLPGVFQEVYVSKKEADYLAKVTGGDSEDLLAAKPDMLAVVVCLVGFFIFNTNYILLEVIGVPLCQQQLGWNENESGRILGILMSAGAFISLFAFGSIGPITKKVDDRVVYLVLGILPMLLSRVAHIPMSSDYPKPKGPSPNSTLATNNWLA